MAYGRRKAALTLAPNTTLLAGVACNSSSECRAPPRDRSYCRCGQCVGGGGRVFSPTAFLTQDARDYDELQTGVLGGHLRVASVGCYSTHQRHGFEMLALGPLSPATGQLLGPSSPS